MNEPRYLSPAEVCDLIPGMTVGTLKTMRARGKGPRYAKPTGPRGHVTLYLESDVRAWIQASVVATRDQPK
ncbi:hypothetical protein A9Z40_08195 [Microbacterium arborescens]|uniref:Helix-turn-helix domain-containing protein n=1 Tax=Microbacterium arborescens TaxID=33883 RepID=A0ABX2WGH3_9MICO|nr:hypothetical protein A9Z40_08195 [Microbacterium arborescens]